MIQFFRCLCLLIHLLDLTVLHLLNQTIPRHFRILRDPRRHSHITIRPHHLPQPAPRLRPLHLLHRRLTLLLEYSRPVGLIYAD